MKKYLAEMLKLVEEFYIEFNQQEYLYRGNYKFYSDSERYELRNKLFDEELKEYLSAENNDIIEHLDAVGDMYYILLGTLLENSKDFDNAYHKLYNKHKTEPEVVIAEYYRKRSGISDVLLFEVFKEIHRSNLSKLDDEGNPVYREDGKIIKSNNYFPPDIRKIYNDYFEDDTNYED